MWDGQLTEGCFHTNFTHSGISREDLSMENGLITKGARLMIPSTLRRKVLEQIHEGHLGIEKCMLKARDSVFWPGISNDIRDTVEKC